jgi:molecular chaperone GrpE
VGESDSGFRPDKTGHGEAGDESLDRSTDGTVEADDDIEIIGFEAVDDRGVPIGEEEDRGESTAGLELSEEGPSEASSPLESGEAQLVTEMEALKERHARLLAEFDNYRKRRDREANESRSLGAEAVLKHLLPVVDNMERALDSIPEGTPPSVHEGIELIQRQMIEAMRQKGVEPIEALGEKFDPEIHEAVSAIERRDFDDQTIIEELQRGYRFDGRLLRPALVRVVMNPGGARGDAPGPDDKD